MTSLRYVGDTSVVVQALVAETYSPQVKNLLAGLNIPSQPAQLWIPDYCLVECSNVLWSQSRFNGMDQVQVETHLQRLLSLPFHIASSRVLLPLTMKIALSQTITTYDAGFLALAKKTQMRFDH